MQPKQKLRLLSLAYLIPFLSCFAYLGITGRRLHTIPAWIFVVAAIYLSSTWTAGMTYMIRHRQELRAPPEEPERQKQWAMKNGHAVLNGLLLLFFACDILMIVRLRAGRLDSSQVAITEIGIFASAPAMLLLLWVRHRLRMKKLPPPGS